MAKTLLAVVVLGLLALVCVVMLVAGMPAPKPIPWACGGWYGWNPDTGRCDLGMPSGPPYPVPGVTPYPGGWAT